MNTTLKPALPTASQTTNANNPNKPMHPQGTSMSYGQPSGPIPQNSFPNTNMAHSHASAQQNHFSLNSSGGPHFNMGTIPASNHPVANISQSSVGQVYNPPKNVSYSSGFQLSHGQVQNQNTLPPVSQSLPATSQPSTLPQQPISTSPSQNSSNSNPTAPSSEPETDKEIQENGTPEAKSQTDGEVEANHISLPAPQASTQPQVSQVPTTPPRQDETSVPVIEKPSDEQKPVPEISKEPEESAMIPAPVPSVPEPETSTNDSPQEDSAPESQKEAEDADPLAMEVESLEEKTQEVPQENKEIKTDAENITGDTDDKETDETVVSESEKQTSKNETVPIKLATIPKTPVRKSKPSKPESKVELKTPVQKSPSSGKTKRQRIRTQHYQSPLPEIEIIAKISSSTPKNKNMDDKLIYFYKNEFLAVRNAEGSFYLCQAVQNIYKSSSKIKIRWLSQDKNDKSGEIYTPDFYDLTDFDCILTSLDLTRVDKGKYRLKQAEKERTDSILKRCLAVEKGEIASPSLSEEHPDGLDLSLYKDEEQLKKKRGTKRKAPPRSSSAKRETPVKKTPEAPKVRKVEAKPVKKPLKKVVVKKVSPPEVKKVFTQSSRAARGKRKSDQKTSPVVDQKKALVLARIGKKTAISVSSNRSQTVSRGKSTFFF
nr:zonadhesin-like [Leptinotarsa decemlineata]XP_023012274.1 zonadhesin-like [Leptinotarsa decemlineata]XP_023012275.1 zonadhesin-like [Leptinotarsa decemlineata]